MNATNDSAAATAVPPDSIRPRPGRMAHAQTKETRSDEALLAAIANERDREAFAELYGRFESRAYSLARYLCNGAESPEDAVQNAMLRVWTSAGTFKPGGNPRGWIFRIVAREALRQRARTIRHRVKEVQEPVASDAIDTRAPEASAEEADELEAVRVHLWKLPEEDRRIVALYYGGGLTQEEIGEALAVGQNTVSRRLHEAMAALRKALAGAGCAAALPLLCDDGLSRALTGGAAVPGSLRGRVFEDLSRAGEVLAQASRRAAAAKAGWGAPLAALLLLGAGAGGWYAWTQGQTQNGSMPDNISGAVEMPAGSEAVLTGSENLAWDFSEGEKTEGLRTLTGEWRWDSTQPGGGGMVIDQAIALALPFKGDPKGVYRFDFKWRLLDAGKGMSIGVGWLDEGGHTLYAKVWGGLAKTGRGSTDWTTVTAFLDGNDLIYTQEGEPLWVYEMHEDGMPRCLGLRMLRLQVQTIRVQRIAREDIPADLRDLEAVKRKVGPPRTNASAL